MHHAETEAEAGASRDGPRACRTAASTAPSAAAAAIPHRSVGECDMTKKTKEELLVDLRRVFPDPYPTDMFSTPAQVLSYVQQLQDIYGHPDQRTKEILKDWAIHSWHLMNDCLDSDWRREWPYKLCHYLATISKHYEEPTKPPSKGVSLTFEHRTGFGSAFSNEFQRSDFVIKDNDSGCKIDGEELMKVVVNRLEAEILGQPESRI